jgi:hypothetical protein
MLHFPAAGPSVPLLSDLLPLRRRSRFALRYQEGRVPQSQKAFKMSSVPSGGCRSRTLTRHGLRQVRTGSRLPGVFVLAQVLEWKDRIEAVVKIELKPDYTPSTGSCMLYLFERELPRRN